MYNLIDIGAIDVSNPPASRLLCKPLDETHGGGPKIKTKSEQTYLDVLDWVQRCAACFEP